LCGDAPHVPWVVLTDAPEEFGDLPVRAVRHLPTGPMAADYLQRLPATGNGQGSAAYHDKRFAVREALREFGTAVFVDADSRIPALPPLPAFPRGLAVLPVVRNSVDAHLAEWGPWRRPAFEELARELTGGTGVLAEAAWCHEACFAVTPGGSPDAFLEAWDHGARFLQARGVFSGEGGVMGLAAACAGWSVDYDVLQDLGSAIQHEGGGPKGE
jgi:hypothetical protein